MGGQNPCHQRLQTQTHICLKPSSLARPCPTLPDTNGEMTFASRALSTGGCHPRAVRLGVSHCPP